MDTTHATREPPDAPRIYHAGNICFGHTQIATDPHDLEAILSKRLAFPITRPAFQLKQEHTSRIVGSQDHDGETAADGFVLEETGRPGIIRTADCTPLFFWNDNGATAGLVHVGWRGLAGGIVTNLIQLLRRRRIPFHSMNFWLGPAIEGQCYAVGDELPRLFPGPSPSFWGFSRGQRGQWRLDVRDGVENVLRQAGFPARRIRRSALCTFCSEGMPSYRREGPGCGRILNFILRIPIPFSRPQANGPGERVQRFTPP